MSLDAGELNGSVSGTYPNMIITGVPFGVWPVTWIAEDVCGNRSECTFYISSLDETPPVVVCDHHTRVSLTEDFGINHGLTKIPASAIDDGTFDNCGPVTLEVRRMSSCIDFDWTTGGAGVDETPNGVVNAADKGMSFSSYVPFACCDAGAGVIMVELRAEDQFGNFSSCMVEVEVDDKLSPSIECPPEVVVSCDFWFDAQ